MKDCSIANKNKFKIKIQHIIEEQNSTLTVTEGTRWGGGGDELGGNAVEEDVVSNQSIIYLC